MHRLPRGKANSGFTLFELVLVIILVAVFSGILFGRLLQYQELAEKAAMEQTVGAVRSALTIQMAGLISRGRTEDIPKLAAVNPMTLLSETQKNYLGEFYETARENIPPGSWYFDLKRRQLVYVVRHGAHFATNEPDARTVRFKTAVVYNDWLREIAMKKNGVDVGGVVLTEVHPYSWSIN